MDVKEILEQIEAGLDGVTPGPWNAFPIERIAIDEDGHYGVQSRKGHIVSDCGHHAGKYAKGNTAHIARCDPDTIRAIIAHVRELEARAEKAEAENKRLCRYIENITQ